MEKPNQKPNYPCWLTPAQLREAQALIDIGFHYCGDVDDYCIGYPVGSLAHWKFYSCESEIALDAVCNGALYSLCLEDKPGAVDDDDFLEKQLASAKKAIRRAQHEFAKASVGIQLTLF